MNDKFFDLKKEKQDRMINAGLEVFAQNGYHHASTDEIVARARISKGLLFHYFGSKAGYYSFLYDYITRYALLELNGGLSDAAGMDYFDLQEQLLKIESDLLAQYPYLYLFLFSVGLENDTEGLASLSIPAETVSSFYQRVQAQADLSRYLHVDSKNNLTQILHHVRLGIMREVLSRESADITQYAKLMGQYLETLRHLASAL